MSVIKISNEEFEEIEAMVLDKIDKIPYALRGSIVFLRAMDWQRTLKEKDPEDVVMRECVCRMFWYLSVANKTAFSLQYQEEPGFFEGIKGSALYGDKDLRPKYSTFLELNSRLGFIDYNLSTNDGNRFLGEDYEDLFERIRSAVKSEIVDQTEKIRGITDVA